MDWKFWVKITGLVIIVIVLIVCISAVWSVIPGWVSAVFIAGLAVGAGMYFWSDIATTLGIDKKPMQIAGAPIVPK